jgi:uncharacterized protein (TIGR02001 family)
MKKTLLAVPLALASCFASLAHAGDPTDLGGGFSLSGNGTITNDYRFRGYSQTDFRPAAQLGLDLTHSSGFYVGNWNSNVSSALYTNGNLEMDLYGGFRHDIGGGFGIDVGVLHYYYPGSDSPKGGNYNNTDLYVGGTYGNYSLKYSYTPGDFFSTPDSHGTWYLDASANFDLGDGWGLLGHVGYQKLKNSLDANGDSIGHYVDYKLGVTKNYKDWVFGLAAVGAGSNDWYDTKYGNPAGRLGVVASISRTF